MSDVLLNVRGLSISFGRKDVVVGTNFKIHKATTTAIVGESGSGKSVTALSVLGLLPSTATLGGEILFEDQNLLMLPEKKMQRIRGKQIAMIFQEPMLSLNPVFTIGDQIEEVYRYHQKLSRKNAHFKTKEILAEVGVNANRIHAYPHEFSGGMRQRVMIAMALANEPSLLIADEPTTALDATTSKQIINLLISVRERRSMSMLFISHDFGVVSSIADEICVMQSGKVVEQGRALHVLQNPSHKYTKALLACRPSLNSKKLRLQTISVET